MNFDPTLFFAASIAKSPMMEEAGLEVTEQDGEFIIADVGGIFGRIDEVKKGSRLLKLQDKDIHGYSGVGEIKKVIEESKSVSIEAVRNPDCDEHNDPNDPSMSEAEGLQLEPDLPKES